MSRLTLQMMADPELQHIAAQAYSEAKEVAKVRGTRITLDDVVERIEELSDWRKRALRAEAKLRRKKL